MKKVKYLLITFIVLFTINVKASCSTEEMNRLATLAKNVEFTYDYKLENLSDESGTYEYANFSITAYNLNKEVKVLIIDDYYLSQYQEFKYTDNKIYTLSNFSNNEKVLITFKGLTTNDCSGTTVYTKTINLPFYNSYANEESCQEYPDFKYCKTLLNDRISYETFMTEMDKYIASLKNDDNPSNDKSGIDYKSLIIGIVIVLTIILVITLYVMRIKKERKKNSL